ncbi:MAG: hypothetical protein ACK5KR_01600 [Breznakia sp.]
MDKYISWDEVWKISFDREKEVIDETTAFHKFVNVFKHIHGGFVLQNKKIVFKENYDLKDYRYSTSIIGSNNERWKVEQFKRLLEQIHEEQDVIDFYLKRINSIFKPYKPIFLELLYDRYFQSMKIENIQKKYKINNKKYYYIIESSEYLFKDAVMILKPPPQIIEHIKMLEKNQKEHEIKFVNEFIKNI